MIFPFGAEGRSWTTPSSASRDVLRTVMILRILLLFWCHDFVNFM